MQRSIGPEGGIAGGLEGTEWWTTGCSPREDPSGVDPAGFEHYVELLRQGSAGNLRVAAASRVLQREAHRTHLLAKAALGAGYSILDDPARLYSDFRPVVVPAPKLKAAIKDPEEVASDEPEAAVPDGPLGGTAPEGADGGAAPDAAPKAGGGGKAGSGAGAEPPKAAGKEKATSGKKPASKKGGSEADAGGVGGIGGEEEAGPPPDPATEQDALAQNRCGWDKRLKLLRMKEREMAEEKQEGRVTADPKKLEDAERLMKELSEDARKPMADPCGEKTEEELEEAWRETFDPAAAAAAAAAPPPAAATAAPPIAVASAVEPGGLAAAGAAALHVQELSAAPAGASRRGRRARACLRQRCARFL